MSFSILFPLAFYLTSAVSPLQQKIQKILKPYGSQVGFSVRDSQGVELAEVNGELAMSPASVAKLVSSACSLSSLGQNFQFETEFGMTGSLQNGVLDGDLVIRGAGDPSYVIEDLKENLERLAVVYGIKEIRGKLIFDTSFFEKPELLISDDFNGDQDRSFRAKLTPLALNFNSFSIWAVADGNKSKVEILPKGVWDPKIINQVKVARDTSLSISIDFAEEKIRVSGTISSDGNPKVLYRALPDPYAAFARLFKRVWLEQGGIAKFPAKDFQISTSPVRYKKLFSHTSRSINRMFLDINKLSTNFGAEMILLTAGAKKFGAPATLQKSKKLLSSCLNDLKISEEKIRLENASGLSRTSKIHASALSAFLTKVKNLEYAPEYLSSFSILGRDGTTKARLSSHAGRARLKTGTIQNVKSIAGYVFPSSLQPMSMVLFFNCPKCSQSDMLDAEDDILRLLLESKEL
ncbi:MAG: D-alanyl-D-alanine carboxypeptidase/D-alanyl-D-alanine-endopeptidase [Deltaproteobacteria bacterium]|nr:D-alanyl-D-alanine carboxypeptidase/D-alanyl-D-alanine-endopeptidase [Deltaproteobacteria bacterium]